MTFLKLLMPLFFLTAFIQCDQTVPVNPETYDSDDNDEDADEDVLILEEDVDYEEPQN